MNISDVSKTYRFRLDSEYYLKKFLNNEKFLQSSVKIKDLCFENICNIKSLSLNKDFNYLEISGVKTETLDYTTNNIVHTKIPNRATYILKNDDIVVSKVRPNRNAVGLISNANRLVGTSGFTVLRADKTKISPYYLYAFTKTKFFVTKLIRENTATMYPAVSDDDILNINIPILSPDFQTYIAKIVKSALIKIQEAEKLYYQAKKLLIQELGTDYFVSDCVCGNIVIKMLKESFFITRRLDAEYYQSEYVVNTQKLKNIKLGSLVEIKESIEAGSEAYSNEGLPYIRISDYTIFGISKPKKYLSDQFCKENKDLLQNLYLSEETILFSKDASIGLTYMMTENLKAITSKGILHIKVKDKSEVLPEYLTLVLNSYIVKKQVEQVSAGSILLHLHVNKIEDVTIPIIDIKIQEKIAQLVQESFSLRKQSELLVQEAKELVEKGIIDNA